MSANDDVSAQASPNSAEQHNYPKKLSIHTTNDYGIPITVTDTAVIDENGDVHIPHPDRLMAAAALFRCTLPQRLNGQEMKFVRKSMGMSAKDWAAQLSSDPSTLSRWESGKQPISVAHEKLLRLTAIFSLRRDAPGIDFDKKDVTQLRLEGFAQADKFLSMTFYLTNIEKRQSYADLEEVA